MVFNPFIMAYLLRKVSCLALVEKTLIVSKLDYTEGIANTSTFFPRITPHKKY